MIRAHVIATAMPTEREESGRARLRRLAEQALRQSRRREDAARWLERLLGAAPDGSDDALFAHRHLAELRLEGEPWVAALHLRKVLAEQPDDDVGHALMGLCQALLGNFRASVGAYRRALRVAPTNPWYHHNMGHLLDVALGKPGDAVEHLRTAHRLEPEEDEITASLSHCLARLGHREEARSMAQDAVRLAPRNPEHRSLLDWIDGFDGQGPGADGDLAAAPGAGRRGRFAGGARNRGAGRGGSGRGRTTTTGGRAGRDGAGGDRSAEGSRTVVGPAPGTRAGAAGGKVERHLERGMREAGFSARQVASARALWADFHQSRAPRIQKPEVFAAAVEYAIALLHGVHGVTQASVAKRYGVAVGSISNRYGEIRETLELEPGDPRYAS